MIRGGINQKNNSGMNISEAKTYYLRFQISSFAIEIFSLKELTD